MHEISIIIPVYNKEKYLTGILEDICRQSFRDFECILIDDGSYDSSGKICDLYAEKDPRFRALHIPNGGVSHARNIGLSAATGRYITFIDADDHVQVNYLEQLYTDITTSGADLVIVGPVKFWEDGRPNEVPEMPYTGLTDMRTIMPEFAQVEKKTGIYGFCWGKIFLRELAQGVQFSEWLRLAEDFEFYLHIYPKIKTVYFDSHCKYYYLQEAENSSALVSSDAIDYVAQLRLNLRYRDFLKQMEVYQGQNQSILEELLCNYLYFSMFHCPIPQFSERFVQLRSICAKEALVPHGDKVLQKWLLFWLRKGICFMPKFTMRLYRFARDLLK